MKDKFEVFVWLFTGWRFYGIVMPVALVSGFYIGTLIP